MGGIFKAPKIAAPPPIQAPRESDFSYEDEEREKAAKAEISNVCTVTQKRRNCYSLWLWL